MQIEKEKQQLERQQRTIQGGHYVVRIIKREYEAFCCTLFICSGKWILKQYAIEIEGGYICHIFPFSEEIESVEWFPGVILLTPQEESDINTLFNFTNIEKQSIYIPKVTIDMKWRAYLLYPFNFVTMQPVAETLHRQLQ